MLVNWLASLAPNHRLSPLRGFDPHTMVLLPMSPWLLNRIFRPRAEFVVLRLDSIEKNVEVCEKQVPQPSKEFGKLMPLYSPSK